MPTDKREDAVLTLMSIRGMTREQAEAWWDSPTLNGSPITNILRDYLVDNSASDMAMGRFLIGALSAVGRKEASE